MNDSFSFIDLFAGIGGFHQAMRSFGGRCVLASEIDPFAIAVYKKNYGIDADKNIRDLTIEMIPDHDVLCAGFPCQAFSKAGKQEGFLDEVRGTLFFEIARILDKKHPKYILLENVKNLASHNHHKTYATICKVLRKIGYRIPPEPLILSPHQFGVPHVRERLFIPGIYDPEHAEDRPLILDFRDLKRKEDNSITRVLEGPIAATGKPISEHRKKVLGAWDEFYHGIDIKTIGFPVWSAYFKTTRIDESLPDWKKDFIRKNQDLYIRNKTFIDSWLKKWGQLKGFTPTERKFEWQCGTSVSSIWDAVIQVRPSGIRVKRPETFPALVALVQTPIIGKYGRELSVREAARLQSFPESFVPDDNRGRALKQLGNSVNVEVLRQIFSRLIEVKL